MASADGDDGGAADTLTVVAPASRFDFAVEIAVGVAHDLAVVQESTLPLPVAAGSAVQTEAKI